MEKPKSLQEYIEKRENPSYGYSDGSYNELLKKLQETRDELLKSSDTHSRKIAMEVEESYNSRAFNLEVENKRRDSEIDFKKSEELGEVARKLIEWRNKAGLAEDPDLQRIFEERMSDKIFHENREKELDEAVESNQNSQEMGFDDPRIIGKIEEDAYKEDSERNAL